MKDNSLSIAIARINAKATAWVAEDPDNRFAGLLTDDLSHWADMGVTTAEELEHYLLVCEAYESHKSAWGFKPHWGALMQQSNDQLKREIAHNNTVVHEAYANSGVNV